METVSAEQIRNFRLQSHHLDAEYPKRDIGRIAGACGLPNSPPGAWETALYNRVPDCTLPEMEQLLYQDKTLLQAWSIRGLPVVFPASESAAFLSALISDQGEPWIYTAGITGALDYLQLPFGEVFRILKQVIPKLDSCQIVSKSTLDQTLAEWMLPLLPSAKRELWNQPSMYGSPDKQTVGGAAVSFLLRPCAFCGLVVFGEREGVSPTFTSYKNWMGREPEPCEDAVRELVRKYLHCYGPSTKNHFISFTGCSASQGKRMWETVSEETEPVLVSGKKAFILSSDKDRLFSPVPLKRELLLLGGHDPYLDQRDRLILQPEKALHKQIWKLVSNPGAIVYRGEVIGIWTGKKKGGNLEIRMTLWKAFEDQPRLEALAQEYAAFRQQRLVSTDIGVLESC